MRNWSSKKIIENGIEYHEDMVDYNGKREWYLYVDTSWELVYMDSNDKTADFKISNSMAMEIIKYKLSK